MAQEPPLTVAQAILVAGDSSGRSTLPQRAAALHTLGASCPREALPVLSRLAHPYVGDWIIWRGALAALAACPYAELAPFWREMITFPRLPVREIAIVGLLRTGEPGDIALIREATHRETDPLIVRLAERADSVLKLPPGARAAALRR
jgi:HEAT repeat protein